MADVQILAPSVETAPADLVLPASAEITPRSVRALFDGTSAATPFLPTLVLVSDAGHEAWRIPTAVPVAAGGTAEVSWAPFLDGRPPGLPLWQDILGTLSLNYGAYDSQFSYAYAMVQAAGPLYTVLVWLRLELAADYSPNATPFQIIGLPPPSFDVSADDAAVTAPILLGISDTVGSSDLSGSYPAFVDATGNIQPQEHADPVVCADNYRLAAVIFAGFGVYPYDPQA